MRMSTAALLHQYDVIVDEKTSDESMYPSGNFIMGEPVLVLGIRSLARTNTLRRAAPQSHHCYLVFHPRESVDAVRAQS